MDVISAFQALAVRLYQLDLLVSGPPAKDLVKQAQYSLSQLAQEAEVELPDRDTLIEQAQCARVKEIDGQCTGGTESPRTESYRSARPASAPSPTARTVTPSGDVAEALELCQKILSAKEEFEEGTGQENEFFTSVGEKTKSMQDFIQARHRVSEKQLVALSNMWRGAQKFLSNLRRATEQDE